MALITIGGSITLAQAPSFTSDGKFTDSYSIGLPVYSKRLINTAGVDGAATRRGGFRSRSISCVGVYVSSTYNAVISTANTDISSIANSAVTVVIGGVSYPYCELVGASVGVVRGVGSKFFAQVEYSFNQTSLA